MQLIIVPFSCRAVCTDGQCTGKYMTAVIIRMLSDQIDTPRRKINLHALRISEQFPKFLQ